MAYKLELTEYDLTTISFVGNRYSWSKALLDSGMTEGINNIAEHEAWKLKDAFEEDTEGGHSHFPLLDERSELYRKLCDFMDSIV